mgnify:CR=1 FL=1
MRLSESWATFPFDSLNQGAPSEKEQSSAPIALSLINQR